MSESRRSRRSQKKFEKKRKKNLDKLKRTAFFIRKIEDPEFYLHPDPNGGKGAYIFCDTKIGAGVWTKGQGERMVDYIKEELDIDTEIVGVGNE